MKIYNKSKRTFTTSKGLLRPGSVQEMSKKESEKLLKYYPLELIDVRKKFGFKEENKKISINLEKAKEELKVKNNELIKIDDELNKLKEENELKEEKIKIELNKLKEENNLNLEKVKKELEKVKKELKENIEEKELLKMELEEKAKEEKELEKAKKEGK